MNVPDQSYGNTRQNHNVMSSCSLVSTRNDFNLKTQTTFNSHRPEADLDRMPMKDRFSQKKGTLLLEGSERTNAETQQAAEYYATAAKGRRLNFTGRPKLVEFNNGILDVVPSPSSHQIRYRQPDKV
jgi:hypothetical protein